MIVIACWHNGFCIGNQTKHGVPEGLGSRATKGEVQSINPNHRRPERYPWIDD